MNNYDKYLILNAIVGTGGIDRIGIVGDDGATEPTSIMIAGPVGVTWSINTSTGIATLQNTPIQFSALSGMPANAKAYLTSLFSSGATGITNRFASDTFPTKNVSNNDIARIISATLSILE